ncbi:uncharacterized protein LOC142359660 isoform X1 [Opisthocomus hoazin]|uniref:uncharacterized protein LOC142359660 isoform X1 n=1 Tax=Opisthocomus hoazin TaxID=30419 RepID=UPI003F539EA0
MELIFLLVAAVVRVSEEENVDSGHVPSHHHQSRPFPSFPCPGGRATRQTAEPANGNAPHHGRRALFMDGAGHGDVELSAFWFSGSLNPLSARSLNFLRAAHRSPNGSKSWAAWTRRVVQANQINSETCQAASQQICEREAIETPSKEQQAAELPTKRHRTPPPLGSAGRWMLPPIPNLDHQNLAQAPCSLTAQPVCYGKKTRNGPKKMGESTASLLLTFCCNTTCFRFQFRKALCNC